MEIKCTPQELKELIENKKETPITVTIDVYKNEINFNDMVINVKDYDDNRVKVPKVVE